MIECRVWRGPAMTPPPPLEAIQLEVMFRESRAVARFDFYRDGVLVLCLGAREAREVAHEILSACRPSHPAVQRDDL